jgi:hypothetical protein
MHHKEKERHKSPQTFLEQHIESKEKRIETYTISFHACQI